MADKIHTCEVRWVWTIGVLPFANAWRTTGSVIPLYRQKIMAFEQLLNHPRAEVVEWAEKGIQRANREIAYETKRESYEQLTYRE